jgi:hypothetical protein
MILRTSFGALGRTLRLGLVLLVAFSAGSSIAASQSPELVPRNALVQGRNYGQWLAAAYRWRLSLHAVTAKQTSCFTGSQHGPVWFLSGSEYGGPSITRTCKVPSRRYLMILTPTIDCSTVERPPLHAITNAGLRRCAKALWLSHGAPRP